MQLLGDGGGDGGSDDDEEPSTSSRQRRHNTVARVLELSCIALPTISNNRMPTGRRNLENNF